MSEEEVIRGKLGLLQIIRETNCHMSDEACSRLQRKIDSIEMHVQDFFKGLASRIEEIEGLDLTDSGDDIIGVGLCMLVAATNDDNSSGSDYADKDDEDSSSCSPSSSSSDNEDDASSSSDSGRKRKHEDD